MAMSEQDLQDYLATHTDRFAFLCPTCQAWQVQVAPEAAWTMEPLDLLEAVALATWRHAQTHNLGTRHGYSLPVLIPGE